MEVIIAVVVVGGIIWFGLATIASRRDENGMDAQDRYFQRKATERQMQRQAQQDGRAAAEVAIGYMGYEQQLLDQGMAPAQAREVSRIRTARHRDEGHARPLWDCASCDRADTRAARDDDAAEVQRSFASMSVEEKRAVLEATSPDVLAQMREAGIVTDRDFCLLLNISDGTDADEDIDLNEYRSVLSARIAAYSTMGPSALIEDVESGLFQFTMEDAGVLEVLPQPAIMELMEGLIRQYKRAKAMPADVRALADAMQPS